MKRSHVIDIASCKSYSLNFLKFVFPEPSHSSRTWTIHVPVWFTNITFANSSPVFSREKILLGRIGAKGIFYKTGDECVIPGFLKTTGTYPKMPEDFPGRSATFRIFPGPSPKTCFAKIVAFASTFS